MNFDCLQVKTGMTMTEKILARASEKTQLSPGENVWVNVDVLMTHDVCGPGSIGIFKKEFGQNAKVLESSCSALYGIWVNCFVGFELENDYTDYEAKIYFEFCYFQNVFIK